MITVLSVARRIASTASSTTEYTLEPLPLHGIAVHLEATVNAANTDPNIDNVVAQLSTIELVLAGTTLWSVSGRDLGAMMPALLGRTAHYLPNGAGATDLLQANLYLPLGRKWAGGAWGLPATPAGQLRLRLTTGAAAAGFGVLTWSIDAVHNDDLQPTGFLRCTTLARTAAATGDLDIDLPVGRRILGIGLFGTTQRTASAGARGIDRIKLLRDSLDVGYPSAEWETLQNILNLGGAPPSGAFDHRHIENTAGVYAQNALTLSEGYTRGLGYSFGYVDLDPLADQSMGLDLTQCNRAVLRATMGVAEALRVLPVEWWTPGAATGAPGRM